MLHRTARLASAAVCLFLFSATASGQNLTVIGWNVESGGADTATVARRIAATEGCDIWGLSEVPANAEDAYTAAAAEGESGTFESVLGSTGGADRLLIIYNTDKLRFRSFSELGNINPQGRYRAPLVATLEHVETGTTFLFMVNHLARGNANARHQQSKKLNDWAENLTMPVIAVGDYNYDYPADEQGPHDKGLDHLTEAGVFYWVKPAELIKTQDSHYNSVLDFVFTANAATSWPSESTIVVVDGDFPDDDQTPDHRPLLARFQVGGSDFADTGPLGPDAFNGLAEMAADRGGLDTARLRQPRTMERGPRAGVRGEEARRGEVAEEIPDVRELLARIERLEAEVRRLRQGAGISPAAQPARETEHGPARRQPETNRTFAPPEE